MKYKIFKDRASLYDHLAQTNPYIHGIYQVCKVQFTFFLAYIFLRDSYKAGRPWWDLSKDLEMFGSAKGWLVLLGLEALLIATSLLLYPVFHIWKFLWSKVGVAASVLYFLFLCGYGAWSIYVLFQAAAIGEMGSVPKAIAAIECCRLIMKTFSFIQENGSKVLNPWSKDDEKGPAVSYGRQMSPQVGSFSQYVYFLVAPTLVYRDHYPKNKGSIKWRNVAAYTVQFLMVYVTGKVMFQEQYPKSFKQDDLASMFMLMLLVSPLMNILGSILILHAWFNLTAELTRFADREFYLHWWSALGYTEYYRLWNVPIHDFTTFYIYRALKPYVPRALAGLAVFTLSAFMHDFIIGFALGFYLPVFLILFAVIGGIVFASRVKFSKYMTFMLTSVGYVLYVGVYYLELGARHYCPPDDDLPLFTVYSPHCFLVQNNVTLPSWAGFIDSVSTL